MALCTCRWKVCKRVMVESVVLLKAVWYLGRLRGEHKGEW